MIIGPNGTGKSSIVCAICIGLGGKTSKSELLPIPYENWSPIFCHSGLVTVAGQRGVGDTDLF